MIMTVFPSTAGATWSTPPSGVITRCTTRSMRVSGATIRALPGDPGWLLAPVSPAASGAGPVAVAGELLCRVRAELPAVGQLGSGSSSCVGAAVRGRGRRAAVTPTPETWWPGSAGSPGGDRHSDGGVSAWELPLTVKSPIIPRLFVFAVA